MTRPACETCGDEGTVIIFRRFAGEYQAGEPVEVPCPDCGGEPEIEVAAPREPYVQSDDFRQWLIEIELRKDGGRIAA